MMHLFTPLSGANFEQVFSAPLSQEKQHDIIGVSLSFLKKEVNLFFFYDIVWNNLKYNFPLLIEM